MMVIQLCKYAKNTFNGWIAWHVNDSSIISFLKERKGKHLYVQWWEKNKKWDCRWFLLLHTFLKQRKIQHISSPFCIFSHSFSNICWGLGEELRLSGTTAAIDWGGKHSLRITEAQIVFAPLPTVTASMFLLKDSFTSKFSCTIS